MRHLLLVFIGEVRMSKSKICLISGILLILCLALTGCDHGSTGGGTGSGSSGSKGTLIMQNSPIRGFAVYVCDNGTPTTIMEFNQAIQQSIAHGFTGGISPNNYQLYSSTDGFLFSGTGSYLVIFETAGPIYNYFKENVSFINGSATVDFYSMTSTENLPFN
jgi:hypothetical protein